MYFFLSNLNTKVINKEESAHFFSMRPKVGDELVLTDLQGNWQKVKLTFVDKKIQKIAWEVLASRITGSPEERVLFQAITDKNYLEKFAEILAFSGFTKVYLYKSERTPKQNLDINRFQKILIRGCELAQLTWIPELEVIQDVSTFEALIRTYKPMVLEQQECSNTKTVKQSIACLVGPEGGWGEKELNLFKSLNLPFETLGSTVFPSWLAGFAWSRQL